MKKALFVHASLNIKNLMEKDSLILSSVANGKTALSFLLDNVMQSRLIDEFFLVTSDQTVDDRVVTACEPFKKRGLNIIRIPSSSSYAIDEKNCFIDTSFTVRFPRTGLFTAKGMLDTLEKSSIDFVLCLQADNHVLLNASLIDEIIPMCSIKGDLFSLGHPSTPLIAMPTSEIKSLVAQIEAERKIKIRHLHQTIEDDNDFLGKEYNTSINIELKKRKACESLTKPILLMTLIDFHNSREGRTRKPFSELFPGKEMQFYPLYTDAHLQTVRTCIQNLESLSLENFFEIESSSGTINSRQYPGYLEVEITSRCNLSCNNCPQTVLKRQKGDMDEKTFTDIIDVFAAHVPMLSLSGFGEPLLHTRAVDFVRIAKEKGFLRVVLETNTLVLDKEKFHQLQAAGLDILVINLDAIDMYSGKENSDEVIEKLLGWRGENKKPAIVIQALNNMQKKKKLDYYFRKWQYIVDSVLLLPFNDFLGTFHEEDIIDFTPQREENSICMKTFMSSLILSSGEMVICKQHFEGMQENSGLDLLSLWTSFKPKGLHEDYCKSCRLWYQKDIPPLSELSHLQTALYEDQHSTLIQRSIEKGKALYNEKLFEEALDEWERVLRFDPSNDFIHQKLDELLEKLEKDIPSAEDKE